VSGSLAETERERQLRKLASRLLTYPYPGGPPTVDLLPVGYPDDLPPELVDRANLRFLGSAVRRRGGALLGAELVFEGPGEPDAIASDYEWALVGAGWQRLDGLRHAGGGFEKPGLGETITLVDKHRASIVFIHAASREDGGSELRVRFDAEHARDMIANSGRGLPPETSMLPRLEPPPGVTLVAEATDYVWMSKSDAWAQTEMAPMALEAHFAKQLEDAGWGRMSGSADEAFAWSSWLIPDSGKWRGVLLVLAAFPGWRHVSVRAETIQPLTQATSPLRLGD
jgi:hypothetical protein